jgi:hypothetical protein
MIHKAAKLSTFVVSEGRTFCNTLMIKNRNLTIRFNIGMRNGIKLDSLTIDNLSMSPAATTNDFFM